MKTCFSIIALCALAVGFAGCTQSLSPEMKGLAQTPDETHNMVRVANNQNVRMISDDLARAWYLDHPSRLSPFPVSYTSGMPR